MGRTANTWGYVVSTLVACGALCAVACGVETTTVEHHVTPTDPAAADPGTDPTPPGDTAASGSSGKTASGGTSGSSGAATSGGTSGSSGAATSGGTSGSSGAATSGGTSGSSGGMTGPFDQFEEHNLATVNMYRAMKSLQPVTLDLTLCTFALKGSLELSMDHTPHQHFITAGNDGSLWNSGFMSGAAENQGDPNGWYKMNNDPTQNELLQIDDIQLQMFNEGPGTGEAHGHYMNMMNPAMKRLGVGLLMVGTSLYLTNDFSE
jgi:uncharacterized protein YkwD